MFEFVNLRLFWILLNVFLLFFIDGFFNTQSVFCWKRLIRFNDFIYCCLSLLCLLSLILILFLLFLFQILILFLCPIVFLLIFIYIWFHLQGIYFPTTANILLLILKWTLLLFYITNLFRNISCVCACDVLFSFISIYVFISSSTCCDWTLQICLSFRTNETIFWS